MHPIPVWDLPTRLFHWMLVACILIAWPTAEDDGWLLRVHATAGHGVLALVAFRLVWGVVGSRESRFAAFVRPWSEVRAYALYLARLRPPASLGHNPLGGWMIVLLLVFAAATALSGILSLSVRAVEDLHEGLANTLLILAAIHVGGVLVDGLLTGDNLIRAMITGVKEPRADMPVPATPAGFVPAWRGAVAGGLTVALWVWLVATTGFPASG